MLRRLFALDPLVLFLALGGAVFALHALTRSPALDRSDAEHTVVVTDADVVWMFEAFQRRRMRPPTLEELRGLVDRHVRDEVLYREAVARGLDRADPALKRRLAMKLEYLARDAGAAAEPTDVELQAFLDADPARYASAPLRRFQQVYLNADRHGDRIQQVAGALLEALRAQPDQDLTQVGDPLLLEIEQPFSTEEDAARQFGRGFAEAVFALPVGRWEGPVTSGFGVHLVRVLEEHVPDPPTLASVRERVRTDLLARRRDEALASYIEDVLSRYDVQIRSALLQGAVEAP